MATRNIVPRADGEGQVGLAAQAWGKVYADEIYEGGERVTPASLATTSAAGLMSAADKAKLDKAPSLGLVIALS